MCLLLYIGTGRIEKGSGKKKKEKNEKQKKERGKKNRKNKEIKEKMSTFRSSYLISRTARIFELGREFMNAFLVLSYSLSQRGSNSFVIKTH